MAGIKKILQAIEDIEKLGLTVTVRYDEPLKKHTTFKIGGRVRAMYFPDDTETAIKLFDVLGRYEIAPKIMGRGSNILASDEDLDVIVINTVRMSDIELTDTVIEATSGVMLAEITAMAHKNALTGMEFAYGIPGTLGGAVMMNAGAYGGEMRDVVIETTAYSVDKGVYTITGDEHGFSYRSSVFSSTNDIILSSKMKLKHGDKNEIEQRIIELETKRRESQPLDKPSAGSTFKRPKEGYAAALIEQAGLKGYGVGGAQVSEKHSGFIINTGSATFGDVIALIEHIQNTVYKNTGVNLEPEVKIWKS